uniref:SHSP domain-containing protein n=1 Tax=Elaeophora elaphi TaxID=1147741 RepID=A0A0R3S1A4_9BILA
MVWRTFTFPKNTNSADNLISTTTTSSLPPALPLPSTLLSGTPILTSTRTLSVSASTNNVQHKSPSSSSSSSSSSKKQSPSPPRPPPRFHRPTPSNTSGYGTDSNTSGFGTLHNDLPFSMTPAGRFFTHFFDEAMQYFNYPMHDIVWSELPTTNACHGNSINEKIIDNDEKFSIEIDLSDFRAGELLVSYDEERRELLVEGHQKERSDRLGAVERNFKRKFDIPVDAHDGSLAAYLLPSGLLTVQAFKKTSKQPIRKIPIQEVVDIPDLTDQNATRVPTFATSKNATNTTKITPPVPPKPKNTSETNFSTFEKMSKEAEEIPNTEKLQEEKMKQVNFDEIQKPTDESTIKRECLNIFC